jgi:hypothetical protein
VQEVAGVGQAVRACKEYRTRVGVPVVSHGSTQLTKPYESTRGNKA